MRLSNKAIIILAMMAGALLGLSAFTFKYAKGLSYFSTNPRACMNCHIMQSQFDSWQKASHHNRATCVDCHLPHDFFRKYLAKAENGYHHSRGFTFQDFHEPIMIKEKNRQILQRNCLNCHQALVQDMVSGATHDLAGREAVRCIHCHVSVGHGEPVGLGGPE